MIIIKAATKKTLIGTLGAAGLFVAGGQVTAHADTVKVNAGDTVWAYSQKYHVSIDSIVKANKLADANLIVSGQEINIPGAKATDANSSAATSTASATSQAAQTSAATTSAAANTATATDTQSATAAQTGTATGATNGSATYGNGSASYNGASSQQQYAPASSTSSASGDWNSYLGQPYSWGNLDCSGLVQRVYGSRVNGRTTYTQQTTGAHNYNVYSAPKGALVFFGSDSAPYHVGISNGDGTFTHAPQQGENVKVTAMKYYTPSYYVMPR